MEAEGRGGKQSSGSYSGHDFVDKNLVSPELAESYKEERRGQSEVEFSNPYGVWTASYDKSSLRMVGQSNKIHDQALYVARDLGFLPPDTRFNFTYPESEARGNLEAEGFIDEGKKEVDPKNVSAPLIGEVYLLTDFWFDYDIDREEDVLSFYGLDIPIHGREGELDPAVRLLTYLSSAEEDAGIEKGEDFGQLRPLTLSPALSHLEKHGLVWGNRNHGHHLRGDLPPGMEKDLENLVKESQPS